MLIDCGIFTECLTARMAEKRLAPGGPSGLTPRKRKPADWAAGLPNVSVKGVVAVEIGAYIGAMQGKVLLSFRCILLFKR